MSSEIIMGIDCGYTHPGMAVVEVEQETDPLKMRYLFGETIETERSQDRESVASDDYRRISLICKWIREAYRTHTPNRVVIELPLSGARSAMAIKGMAFASALTIATIEAYFEVAEFKVITPYESKRWCCGDSHAEKDDVIKSVSRFFPDVRWPMLKTKPKRDPNLCEGIADSLAAILYLLRVGEVERKKLKFKAVTSR